MLVHVAFTEYRGKSVIVCIMVKTR